MDEKTRIASGTLLRVYADIDLLALELCTDRLPFAPSAKARKELMDQINEEVIHFSIQDKTLEKLQMPFTPVLTLEKRREIKEWFSNQDWYGFLAGLQLGIEGIGISIVEMVSRNADPMIQESLRIPIIDEMRQTSFGILEWSEFLSSCTPQEKEQQLNRVLDIFEQIYLLTEAAFPIRFEEYWGVLGLKKEDLWNAVRERTLLILENSGFKPALPASFVA
ncbi:MAG: hypothetical protein ACYCXP_12015 [Leptospirillum sp.]